jgi:hypothetical protein
MDVRTTAATDADPFASLITAFVDDLTAAGYAPHRQRLAECPPRSSGG